MPLISERSSTCIIISRSRSFTRIRCHYGRPLSFSHFVTRLTMFYCLEVGFIISWAWKVWMHLSQILFLAERYLNIFSIFFDQICIWIICTRTRALFFYYSRIFTIYGNLWSILQKVLLAIILSGSWRIYRLILKISTFSTFKSDILSCFWSHCWVILIILPRPRWILPSNWLLFTLNTEFIWGFSERIWDIVLTRTYLGLRFAFAQGTFTSLREFVASWIVSLN